MGSLSGKVACVTGAARGQGRSHAVALATEGAAVIALDACAPIGSVPYPLPTEADLNETAERVEAAGGRIVTAVVDVRDEAGLGRAVADGVSEFGRLDIVCANAGISTPAPTLTMAEQVWQDTIDINLTGVWKTARVTVPHIIRGGRGGSVIITSSAATEIISANIAHYTASKYGLIGLMKVLAKELAAERIRVNTIHPTGVQTPMILNQPMYDLFRPDIDEPTRADFEESARSHNAMHIFALESSDVSNAVLYLAGEGGRYITGSTLMIDAGGPLI
jgi:SDR family mycofactocin-dependent oxidoreductase